MTEQLKGFRWTDYIPVRREDVEWVVNFITAASPTLKDKPQGNLDRLSAALSAEPVVHASDCAQHNEPAYPNGPCDCGAEPVVSGLEWRGYELWFKRNGIDILIGEVHSGYEHESGWPWYYSLGSNLNAGDNYDTEQKASAALEAAARSWFSPLPVSGEKAYLPEAQVQDHLGRYFKLSDKRPVYVVTVDEDAERLGDGYLIIPEDRLIPAPKKALLNTWPGDNDFEDETRQALKDTGQ